MLTCTCGGIHPGRAEPEPPMELTTTARSLEIFAKSFVHRAQLKTRGPERRSRSSLSVMAHVFSWPPARFCHEPGCAGKRRFLISSSQKFSQRGQINETFFGRAAPVCRRGGGGIAVLPLVHNLCVSRVGCCGPTFRNHRAESTTPLPDRP